MVCPNANLSSAMLFFTGHRCNFCSYDWCWNVGQVHILWKQPRS